MLRPFLTQHPAGTVVALGEGLGTQFWRLDKAVCSGVTVDLPETLKLRHQLLPDGPRQRSHAGSALDNVWLDLLDPAQPVLVTARAARYSQRELVPDLMAAIASRLPRGSLVFAAAESTT